jgi:hypothetical protein
LVPKPKKQHTPVVVINNNENNTSSDPISLSNNNKNTKSPPINVIAEEGISILPQPNIELPMDYNASVDIDLTQGFVLDYNDLVQEVIDKVVSPVASPVSRTSITSPVNVAAKQKQSTKQKSNTQHYIPGTQSNHWFDQSELDYYIDLLEVYLPLCQQAWEDVASLHRAKYPYINRSTQSLKRKYNMILKMTVPTLNPHCPEYVARVFGIKNNLLNSPKRLS